MTQLDEARGLLLLPEEQSLRPRACPDEAPWVLVFTPNEHEGGSVGVVFVQVDEPSAVRSLELELESDWRIAE